MPKSRMFGGDDPEHPETPSPRTTIVGARPPERVVSSVPVPTGIQTLLHRAAHDPAFLRDLITRRADAADAVGVALTGSERAILGAIPATQITLMTEQLTASPRRYFLQQVAAAGAAVIANAALTDCEPRPSAGPPRPDYNEMQRTGGAAPEIPPPPPPPIRPDEPTPPPAGARPDYPPPQPNPPVTPNTPSPPPPPSRPDHNEYTAGIQPQRPQHNPVTRGIRPRPPGGSNGPDDL